MNDESYIILKIIVIIFVDGSLVSGFLVIKQWITSFHSSRQSIKLLVTKMYIDILLTY